MSNVTPFPTGFPAHYPPDFVANRRALLSAIKLLAVVRGKITLSSGQESDYYIDLRRITLDGSVAPLVGYVMRAITSDWHYDAVGGLTLGADPVATAMLHAAAAAEENVDAFVVRKEGKAHGLQRRIEGPDVARCEVLVVEDTTTTGSSMLEAVRALREAGADVVGVAVVVDRGAGAKEAIEAAGLPYRYAFDMSDLDLG